MSTTSPASVPMSKQRQDEFMILLGTHHASFVRYVRAMTKDTEQARDIVAETLLVALERFETLREHGSFLFFLIAIARRQFWRMSKWSKVFPTMEMKHVDLIIDTGAAPDMGPDLRLLHECIAKLPSKQREALVLFEISGLSLNEIRALQGGSLSGVKSRIARARQRLVRLLGEQENEPAVSRKDGTVACIEIEAKP